MFSTFVSSIFNTDSAFRHRRNQMRSSIPSFADGLVSMSHDYDETLLRMFSLLDFPVSNFGLNPAPKVEFDRFSEQAFIDKNNMLRKNALLLSRIFIYNAAKAKFDEHFAGKSCLRILEIGCAHAYGLMGMLAFLRDHRAIDYTGIDLREDKILDCQKQYAGLQKEYSDSCCFTFLHADTQDLLDKNVGLFDLILFSYPDISSDEKQAVFVNEFNAAAGLLAENGVVLCSLYSKSDVDCFSAEILSKIKMPDGVMFANNENNRMIKTSPIHQKVSVPGYYCYATEPKKPELKSRPGL